ncbi:radical SAM family heme chaperone HemW [Pseudooctadecabacter jejudonensis]|uniref:Heme chaperone HemW n=1 Tax=Pseudooctadecabacter jejudonensis TaxID=1391910 RepID=A0A1Y5S6E3_9RHOB|nr:radical SAM family heme chaperone HemW [Pseudooctadecabacter jejudonensis]SLN33536.1 Oxygen-independent coproporphyrinogen-III oxidase 1 [Pseudooctadecabacter jejudonensis]
MPEGFGIYLHWPFCQAKCPYCDFNSHVVGSVDDDVWAEAFEAELDRIAELTDDRLLNSVFFGGGTPSLMAVSTVERIMEKIRARWRLANDLEVTLEANPTSIEADRFAGYHAAGVNRVSVGVQALNDPDLKKLGRLHSAEDALRAVDVARSTFDRVSFDLIYARQDQSIEAWDAELRQALSYDPDHLSLYQLTIEDGTAFGDRFKRGTLRGLPDEDLAADMWDVTQSLCSEAGLPAYEVSNHAKSGQESRHNLIYWSSGDWAGIGPGAHGRLTLDGTRFATVGAKAPAAWLERVKTQGHGDVENTPLTSTDCLEEQVMMGLRLVDGITLPPSWINSKLNEIRYLDDLGLIHLENETLRVSAAGRPVLNSILDRLLAR